MSKRSTNLETFMEGVISHNPGEVEFHQAVREIAADIIPVSYTHLTLPTKRIV